MRTFATAESQSHQLEKILEEGVLRRMETYTLDSEEFTTPLLKQAAESIIDEYASFISTIYDNVYLLKRAAEDHQKMKDKK